MNRHVVPEAPPEKVVPVSAVWPRWSLALAYDVAYLVLALGILGWVTWDALGPRLIAWSPTSDYWEHTAVFHALLEDVWHPRHPLIAENVSSPRFGPHFVLLSLVARALDTDALGAMALSSIVNTALFLGGIYLFFREYFRDRLAPLVALVVMFGSWLDAPHFSNVYKLSVYFSVAGYPSSAALGTMLFGLFAVVRLLRAETERRVAWTLSTLVWAYVYITHPLTAMLALTAALLLALTEAEVPWKRRLWVAGTVPAGLLIASLWPYYPALGMVASGTAERVQEGLEANTELGLHPFFEPQKLFDITGFALLAVPLFPYFFWRRKHLLVPLGTLVMLAVFALSAIVPIPLGHRFVLLAVFFLQIGLVWLLLQTLRPLSRGATGRSWLRFTRIGVAIAAGILLSFLVLSNVDTAWQRFDGKRHAEHSSSPTVRYGQRVGELAGPNAIILADPVTSWPLPTFGPKVVTLHHQNPLVRDATERNRAARVFRDGRTSDDERLAIIARYRVTHVVTLPSESRGLLRFLGEHGKRRGLPLGRALFDVRKR
jgi:hypothetical protein